jgi:hypothetical protein
MTFTIHAWKADQNITTVRIGPSVAIDKARELEKMGWQVYITDAAGSRFPDELRDEGSSRDLGRVRSVPQNGACGREDPVAR